MSDLASLLLYYDRSDFYSVYLAWPISLDSWVEFDLRYITMLPACAKFAHSHQSKQNLADGGTAKITDGKASKIKVNPAQLSDLMDHPVF